MAELSMQGIKRRISSITSIEHITSAMKLVSAAKLRRARNIYDRVEDNLHFITDSIDEILGSFAGVPDLYISSSRDIKRTCYVVITSNRGLAGSFNANVIKEVERLIRKNSTEPLLVCIGSKGRDYFRKRGFEILSEYLDPPEDVTFDEMSVIAQTAIDLYKEGTVDELVIVYTAYISTIEQHAISERLLPFKRKNEPMTDMPEEKKDEDDPDQVEIKIEHVVEYEPSAEAVFSYLVPKYTEIMLYRTVIDSAICEHAARRMAMQNATDNAREMMTGLNLFYNRARQAAITNEITEIVSGAEQVK